MAIADSFDRLFEPVMACLTPQVAQNIVNFRLDPALTARIEFLAKGANEGALTPAEDEEYRDYIEAGDMIALLQSTARRYLSQQLA